jgi:hypothetical protein
MAVELFTYKDLDSSLTQQIVDFLDRQATSHPFQLPRWADAGGRFAISRQGGRICWFASFGTHFPLGRRLPIFRALTINRGPVCDDRQVGHDALKEFSEQMGQRRFLYLDVAPDWLELGRSEPTREFGPEWHPLGNSRFTLRLDITKTEDDLMAGLRKNTRYDVRRAERAQVSAEASQNPSDIQEFLRLYRGVAERKGFLPDPAQHVGRVIAWLMSEPSRGALLLARDKATVVGGAVIMRSAKRCWYVWGANDKNDRFSAGQLLQWRAILWAKQHGCTEYDFGGYTPGAASGPAWFKEGFGGQTVQFVPTQRTVFRPRCHGLVQAIVRKRK